MKEATVAATESLMVPTKRAPSTTEVVVAEATSSTTGTNHVNRTRKVLPRLLLTKVTTSMLSHQRAEPLLTILAQKSISNTMVLQEEVAISKESVAATEVVIVHKAATRMLSKVATIAQEAAHIIKVDIAIKTQDINKNLSRWKIQSLITRTLRMRNVKNP